MEKKKKISLQDLGTAKLLLLTASGIALVMLSMPSSCSQNAKKLPQETMTEKAADTNTYCVTLEERLEEMVCSIGGVESAKAMIMLKSGAEKVVLKDYPYESSKSEEHDGTAGRSEQEYIYSDTTVLVEDADGNTRPYVIKELEPEISGVAIVYKGKRGAEISYQITCMIQALFQIEAHKISVIEQ